VPGITVSPGVNVIVTTFCGVGVGVGVAVGVAVTFAVGTGVGGTVVGMGVGTVVGTGVGVGVAMGAAGFDAHPASRIPTNRIARTTISFFMHGFLLSRYISIFYSFGYCKGSFTCTPGENAHKIMKELSETYREFILGND
jgi:hypothetical protein